MNEEYSDIIDLPHHVSKNHKQMSLEQRAAQFAPFAALTGHEELIKQTTDEMSTSYNQQTIDYDDI